MLEQVVFCQAQPVLTSTGWRMVRDPRTAMSKDTVSLLGWATPAELAAWAHAIGSCGLSLTTGVPVWEAWYNQLASLGQSAPQGVEAAIWDSGLGYMARGVPAGEVTQESRYSFYLAFGITPDLQEDLEAWYSEPLSVGDPTPMTYPHVKSIDIDSNPLAAWLSLARRMATPL